MLQRTYATTEGRNIRTEKHSVQQGKTIGTQCISYCIHTVSPFCCVKHLFHSSLQHISGSSRLEQQAFFRSLANSRLAAMQNYNAMTTIYLEMCPNNTAFGNIFIFVCHIVILLLPFCFLCQWFVFPLSLFYYYYLSYFFLPETSRLLCNLRVYVSDFLSLSLRPSVFHSRLLLIVW